MLSFPAQSWQNTATKSTNWRRNGSNPRSFRAATEIKDRLFLSDYGTTMNKEEMKRMGITHMISVIDLQLPISPAVPDENRILLPLADRSDVDILQHLDRTTNFIIEALKENEDNKVLVHCMQGISRSATVVCAYLIATEGMAAHEAIDYVQSKRDVVCPNLGFRLQLVHYSERFNPRANPLGKDLIQRLWKTLMTKKPKSVSTPPLPTVPAKSTPL